MINHRARARAAWPMLARRANRGENPFTYGELCQSLGLHHRAAQWFLGVIQRFCRINRLPPLQALVVNKQTRIPGSGYVGSVRSRPAHLKALQKVYAKTWPTKPPAF